MASYLMPGLTGEIASRICMTECKAMCCRGPLILELTEAEIEDFEERAAPILPVDSVGAALKITRKEDGGGWIRFSDYDGERCPMLDPVTFACRIYEYRPQRCREFPQRLTPGCAISGG